MKDSLDNTPAAPPSARRLWLTVFAAAATLYVLTAQRGPSWQDSGIFQWRIHTFDLAGQMGLALAHPVLILLGQVARAIPIGPEIWRLSALSGLAGAVAAANLAALVRRLAPKVPLAAWFSAGAFALAHTTWWLATITESHAILAALLSGELLALAALMKRPRVSMVLLLGLLNGLAAATHNLALLALPAYGIAVIALAARRRLKPWDVGLFVLAWAIGALPLLTLVVQKAMVSGLGPAMASALFGERWQGAVLGSAWRRVPAGLGYIVYNLPNLALPLAMVGLWRLKRRVGGGLAAALTCIVATHFLFAVRYRVTDQFMFFVPLYLLLALLAGLGLADIAAQRRRLALLAVATLAIGPVGYALAPAAVEAMGVRLPGTRRTLPHRDEARYWLSPWKHDENSAGEFSAEALTQLAERGGPVQLVADGTTYWPLQWVRAVDGKGPNVELIAGAYGAPLGENPAEAIAELQRRGGSAWVVSNRPGYCPEVLLPYVDAERTGVLYRLRAAPTTSTAPAGD